MASTFSRVFAQAGNVPLNSPVSKHMPMINTIVGQFSNFLSEFGQIRKKKALMNWYRGIPELTALINKVAGDIIGEYHFESLNSEDTKRNKIMKVNRFAAEIRLRKVLFSQVIDILVTGEGFGWMGKITEKQIKEAVDKALKKVVETHAAALARSKKLGVTGRASTLSSTKDIITKSLQTNKPISSITIKKTITKTSISPRIISKKGRAVSAKAKTKTSLAQKSSVSSKQKQ